MIYIHVEGGKARICRRERKGFFERYSIRVAKEALTVGQACFILFKAEDVQQ